MKERDTMENLGVDEREIVELVLKIWNSGEKIEFIGPQDKCRAVVNKVMNLRAQ